MRDQLLRRKKCACWGLSKVNRTSRDYVTYRKYGKWKRLTKLPRASRLTSRRSCHEEDLLTFNALGIFQSVQANRPQKAKESEVQQRDEDVPDEEKRKDQGAALLDVLQSRPPSAFKRLTQRLLHESGSQQVTVTGKSNNGGIGNVRTLKTNPFVSFNVLFQCKRYQGAVTQARHETADVS